VQKLRKYRKAVLLGFSGDDLRLTYHLFKMGLRDRYTGSVLGFYWAVLNPLLQLGIYTFIFGFVLKARIPGADTTFSFAIWLISGLVPWMAMTESMNVATNSVVSGSGIVKNTVFNSECLPIAGVMLGMVPLVVGLFFLGTLLVVDGNYPSFHIWALPGVVLIQFLFLMGAAFFLSAITVFVRDVTQLIVTLMMILMFATPIFYAPEMLPPIIQKVTFYNPFYQIVQSYRDILLEHQLPDAQGMLYLILLVIFLDIARDRKACFL